MATNQYGMSVIEMMIAAGGLAGLAMLASSLISLAARGTQGAQEKSELILRASAIQAILESEILCKCNLLGTSGIQFSETDASSTQINIPELFMSDAQCSLSSKRLIAMPKNDESRYTLKAFTKINPYEYAATLEVKEKLSPHVVGKRDLVQEFVVRLGATTTSGTVRLESCGRPSAESLSCVTASNLNGWRTAIDTPEERQFSASCPLGYTGVSCDLHFYDQNSGGSVYRGVSPGLFSNSARTSCSVNVTDAGITEAQLMMQCCRSATTQPVSKKIWSGFFANTSHPEDWPSTIRTPSQQNLSSTPSDCGPTDFKNKLSGNRDFIYGHQCLEVLDPDSGLPVGAESVCSLAAVDDDSMLLPNPAWAPDSGYVTGVNDHKLAFKCNVLFNSQTGRWMVGAPFDGNRVACRYSCFK